MILSLVSPRCLPYGRLIAAPKRKTPREGPVPPYASNATGIKPMPDFARHAWYLVSGIWCARIGIGIGIGVRPCSIVADFR